MAAEDVRYRQSSQYLLWSFSPSQLAAIREKTNATARSTISARLSSLPAMPNNSLSAPTSNANTPDPEGSTTPALPEYLTPAEEALLVTFYTSELLRAGDHAGMSDEIKATAAAVFRRFYVMNSIMTYPPQEMLIVALFFGCKAEGAFPSISDFGKTFGKEHPEEILAGEFLLCQGLRFALEVRNPFRALRGAVMELSLLGDIETARIAAAERRAREILRFSPLITDAYFHYTPSQIMLAALSLADRGLAERLIQETFHYVAPPANNSGADTPMSGSGIDAPKKGSAAARNGGGEQDRATLIGPHIRDKVLGTVEACRDMLSKELPERREHWTNKTVYKAQLQPLRKKLNKCRDPERSNLVGLQRARRQQAAHRDESDDEDGLDGGKGPAGRLKDDEAVFGDADVKGRKVKREMEDPFGPAL
ncbi:Cyclin CCL1 [Madurella mycetomatis]|uniref:Cyclin CCL1 n=1 Tax=Madurella mycetomatis TaxID=100816 RepID=A0A175VY20_9PEZI|nr:Cyclin CCL1 [Madurella mycetomatis]